MLQHKWSSDTEDIEADVVSVGSDADILDRSFVEAHKPGHNGWAVVRTSNKKSSFRAKTPI